MKIKPAYFGALLALLTILTGCDEQREMIENKITASSVIIGQDDRVRVTGAYEAKNRTVGQLIAFSNNKTRVHRCSATALRNNIILTAAHCIYNNGELLEDMYFYPGIRAEHTQPFGRFPVLQATLPVLYDKHISNTLTVGYDIAVLRVGNNEVGDSLANFVGGRGHWGVSKLPHNKMSTIGYPGDKANSTVYQQTDCYIADHGPLTYETHCDVITGQSGSPAFVHHAASNDDYIVGVIAGELPRTNIIAKITPERSRIIRDVLDGNYQANKNDYLEKWKTIRMPRTNQYHILIKNDCQVMMRVATYSIQGADRWETHGFTEVYPGQTREVLTTVNAVYQLHVHNSRNMRTTIGTSHMRQVPGSTGDFFFTMYAAPRTGDTTHTITNCRN